MLESSEHNESGGKSILQVPESCYTEILLKGKKSQPCWYTRTIRLQCWKNQWKEKPLSCLRMVLQIWSKYKMYCKVQDWRVAQHGSPTQPARTQPQDQAPALTTAVQWQFMWALTPLEGYHRKQAQQKTSQTQCWDLQAATFPLDLQDWNINNTAAVSLPTLIMAILFLKRANLLHNNRATWIFPLPPWSPTRLSSASHSYSQATPRTSRFHWTPAKTRPPFYFPAEVGRYLFVLVQKQNHNEHQIAVLVQG